MCNLSVNTLTVRIFFFLKLMLPMWNMKYVSGCLTTCHLLTWYWVVSSAIWHIFVTVLFSVTYNEDAFILQVIEAYCNSAKTRHTVNSCEYLSGIYYTWNFTLPLPLAHLSLQFLITKWNLNFDRVFSHSISKFYFWQKSISLSHVISFFISEQSFIAGFSFILQILAFSGFTCGFPWHSFWFWFSF